MFGGHHHSRGSGGFSRVRAVHNVANGPKVNVVVDGKIALGDVPYKAVSAYLKVPAGNHAVAITTTNGAKTLASARVNLATGKDYTVVAHGDVTNLSSVALLPLEDNNRCPKPGKSNVRFIHAAATVPAVDIWANLPGNVGEGLKVFKNVSYGNTGDPRYLSIMSATVNLAVTPAGTKDVVLSVPNFTLSPGKTYTLVATGLLNDSTSPISVIVSEDTNCYTHH